MINYDNVTVQDCMDMDNQKNQGVVLRDGKVTGFCGEDEATKTLESIMIKDWLDALVDLYKRTIGTVNFSDDIRVYFPCLGFHIDKGIDEISRKTGISLHESRFSEEYPYKYSFIYKGVEFFQISDKRILV